MAFLSVALYCCCSPFYFTLAAVLVLQASRMTRSDEDGDDNWDAWGTWSECSRTCGGGASYSLRRCLNGENCEGLNIRYRTCSNLDCPPDSGDFRAQQCSAHNDVKYQGRTYEWIPVTDDPSAPCALRCQARGHELVVELAPKVLDGTRCKTDSLDMCISGVCQAVGCDRQLGSNAKEDNCGVCAGDGLTCRLVRGQTLSHVSEEEPLKTVLEVPLGSRNVRITAKGPNVIIVESHSLQGHQEEHGFSSPGSYVIVNTTVDFQKSLDRQTLSVQGPLTVDFIFKFVASQDTLVQFVFYQPIRYQWRETDFFPCSVTCGGGYQLNSAECTDVRYNRTLPDIQCSGYPENRKPKPKLRECNMDPCPESDGFKEVMPYDHFQPLPRWEHNPWTACTVSCGGGIQERTVLCVEENMHGQISQVEDWKCTYSTRPALKQSCNAFDCPHWVAMEWSQCTVTCGRGLRYRVVLCIDHRGQHTGGCNAGLKPHIKEDCLVPVACYKPQEKLPVEAKLPWIKQAQELEEPRASSEEPMFIPGPWQPCSATCGPGHQRRQVTCRVLLTFSEAEVDLPDEECSGDKPPIERACDLGPCIWDSALQQFPRSPHQGAVRHHWEHRGFTPCSSSCAAGTQESIATCVNRERGEVAQDSFCDGSSRPPVMTRTCNPDPCSPSHFSPDLLCQEIPSRIVLLSGLLICLFVCLLPRWEVGPWSQCSATCGMGIQSRKVLCRQLMLQAQGDEATVPDGECKDFRPSVLQACNQVDCPPSWQAEDWLECSHTCGEGVQSRKVHCIQLLSMGGKRKLTDDACLGAKPMAQKPCARRPDVHQERGPEILGLHRIYIQTRQEKRIHFTVGGQAYLLPKTSVVIKCPVRKFQKLHIGWEKDGRPLVRSRRLGITKSGSLKIHSLEASDIGVYRCVAGQATETFILKLIGNDDRLLKPSDGRSQILERHSSLAKLEPSEASHLDENYLTNSTEPSHPLQVPDKHLEATVFQGAYSLEPKQFEELVRNISQLTENADVAESLASQLIRKLMSEASGPQAATEKWAGPFENSALKAKLTDKNHSSSEQAHDNGKERQGKPIIIRQKQNPLMTFQKSINISIGRSAFLTNTTHSVFLLCAAWGVPKPKVTWTKDGSTMFLRISWDSAGGLRVSEPSLGDVGVYGCTATNELGSDSETSQLLLAGETPAHHSCRDPAWDKRLQQMCVCVSEMLRQSDVFMSLSVAGVPQPTVNWHKRENGLDGNTVMLFNGSLFLRNVSVEGNGTYSCLASNPLGTSVASSLLLVSGGLHGAHWVFLIHGIQHSLDQLADWSQCSATCGNRGTRSREVRCVSSGGEEVAPSLCRHLSRPVARSQPCHANVRLLLHSWVSTMWSECSTMCGPGSRQRQVSCQQVSSAGTARLLAPSVCKAALRPADTEECRSDACVSWFASPWGQCSGRCLGPALATQSRPVTCRHRDGSTVPDWHCDPRNRPMSVRRCSLERCSVQWRTGPWRVCSAACGSGFQSRKVECVHRRSRKTLADQHCAWKRRPITWQHCSATSCSSECEDTTHYCAVVKQLKLCLVDLYRRRCCQSCGGEQPLKAY
uniref:ADAMTS like 3 n=1 Tax=Scleropages formosus TaxID=113540 RepID=A0A8D0C6X9_SCLFO